MMIRKRGDPSTPEGMRWSLLISLSALGLPCVVGAKSPAKPRAEYAIRWEAAAGGPRTDADVAKLRDGVKPTDRSKTEMGSTCSGTQ
jgi:hypothetical protein